MKARSPRWPLDPPRTEFDAITHDIQQEHYDSLLASMNVTQRTWRFGRLRLDLRPQRRWGWIAPSMFSVGRISIGWGQ